MKLNIVALIVWPILVCCAIFGFLLMNMNGVSLKSLLSTGPADIEEVDSHLPTQSEVEKLENSPENADLAQTNSAAIEKDASKTEPKSTPPINSTVKSEVSVTAYSVVLSEASATGVVNRGEKIGYTIDKNTNYEVFYDVEGSQSKLKDVDTETYLINTLNNSRQLLSKCSPACSSGSYVVSAYVLPSNLCTEKDYPIVDLYNQMIVGGVFKDLSEALTKCKAMLADRVGTLPNVVGGTYTLEQIVTDETGTIVAKGASKAFTVTDKDSDTSTAIEKVAPVAPEPLMKGELSYKGGTFTYTTVPQCSIYTKDTFEIRTGDGEAYPADCKGTVSHTYTKAGTYTAEYRRNGEVLKKVSIVIDL
jgi:hypothetical protein